MSEPEPSPDRTLWCECEIPSPVETDGAPPECAECRKAIVL